MTGLDLESFLLLLKADFGTWVILGLTTLGLALLVWSSWRSRRALRNCLVVSLAAHLGLVLYGSTLPGFPWTLGSRRQDPARIRTFARFVSPQWSSEEHPAGRSAGIERDGSVDRVRRGPTAGAALGPGRRTARTG